jgi:hypothetical protein
MDINLRLNETEQELEDLFKTLADSKCLQNLTTSQLYNLSVYMDIIKKSKVSKLTKVSKGIKKPISNKNIILHAYNYDIDDNCEYWIVLDKSLKFTDIGIPLNLNVDNKKSFENVPDFESNIIKEIKKYINSDIALPVE